MESTNQAMANLADFHRTLADTTEVLAALISLGRSSELPIESVMRAAEETLPDLCEWRKTIKAVVEMLEQDAIH